MSEQIANVPDICPAIEQLGCVAVPKHVRVDMLTDPLADPTHTRVTTLWVMRRPAAVTKSGASSPWSALVARYDFSILCAGFGTLITRSLFPLPRTWSVAAIDEKSPTLSPTTSPRRNPA